MLTILETRPCTDWLNRQKDLKTRPRIAGRLRRIGRTGSLGDHKDIGDGVGELPFHFGPGYRVYFCRRGAEIVILLGGGDRGSQSRDIRAAKALAKEV
jgi:putative addiction module killer protein